MRKIVEVLNRLYNTGKLTQEQLLERVDKGTITSDEYDTIVYGKE